MIKGKKIAIVTGATGGLGREFVRLLLKEKNVDEIWALARNEKKLSRLKDKFGKKEGIALISEEDLPIVINEKYSWVLHKSHNKISVVANTPEGRIHLEDIIMPREENHKIEHINNNPLDNRKSNLKLVSLEE